MKQHYWKNLAEAMFLMLIVIAVYTFYRCRVVPFETLVKFDRIRIVLNNVHTKEKLYFEQNGYFTFDFPRLGLGKSIDERYTFFFGKEISACASHSRYFLIESLPSYLNSFVLPDRYVIIAVSNIDGDEEYDIWTLNEKGEIIHLVNDMLVGDNKQSCCLIYH